MIKSCKPIIAVIFLALILPACAGRPGFVLAEDMGTTCSTLIDSNASCPNLSSTDCRALLEKCATYYDQQSAQIAQDITKTTAQKNTLQSAVSGLKKKIQSLEYQISQSTIVAKDLSLQVKDTQSSIDKTSNRIADSQSQITQILRSLYEEDKKSSIEILLEGNLSDFFSNIAYLESLNSKVGDLLNTTKNLQNYLQGQKIKMDTEVSQLQKTIAIQSLQKQENEQNKKQQETYLKLTEAQYQQQLKDKQAAEAASAKIKARLFQVAGVTKVPTFGEALDVAKAVGAMVGIRPSFLLAVISQESAIGRNVGQCLLTDINTGVGKRISTGAAMSRVFKVSRDLQPFLQICASVGRDPLRTPVSCDSYGSMGPAQFLPSTWMLFVDRLKSLLGQTADPWAIKDSFTASALYLSDLGASGKTTTTEKAAAYSYNGSGNAARIYSNSVMKRANCIQTFIDNGTMSTDCQNLIF